MPDIKIPNDGFITVAIGDAEQSMDVYRTMNRLSALRREYGAEDQLDEFHEKVGELLGAHGFPGGLSHKVVVGFIRAFYEHIEAIPKKDESPSAEGAT